MFLGPTVVQKRARRACCLLLLLLTAALFSGARSAQAVDAVVGDGTPASCTAEALVDAVAAGGLITFDCGGPKTILLEEAGTLILAADTIVDGAGQITISGNNTTRIFWVPTKLNLTVHDITLTNGLVEGFGAAVFIASAASFVAENSTIQNNKSGNFAGSAIFADGDGAIALRDSVVQNNKTNGFGAINSTGPVTIVDSILRNNTSYGGGGALSVGGEVKVLNSQIVENSAYGPSGASGGGLYATETADVTIENSLFVYNQAWEGGGVYSNGELTIFRSSFIYNSARFSGGGIRSSGPGSFVRLAASSLIFNSANDTGTGGGLLTQDGIATLDNVTVSNNSATNGGGVAAANAQLFLNYVTIYDNEGDDAGNLYSIAGKLTGRNTIIATPKEGINCKLVSTNVTSEGHNLASRFGCGFGAASDNVVDEYEILLGDLADNGGGTLTHMPQPGSPAIDGGSCALAVDQRGAPRPAGNACDIGAVEYGSMAWQIYLPNITR